MPLVWRSWTELRVQEKVGLSILWAYSILISLLPVIRVKVLFELCPNFKKKKICLLVFLNMCVPSICMSTTCAGSLGGSKRASHSPGAGISAILSCPGGARNWPQVPCRSSRYAHELMSPLPGLLPSGSYCSSALLDIANAPQETGKTNMLLYFAENSKQNKTTHFIPERKKNFGLGQWTRNRVEKFEGFYRR